MEKQLSLSARVNSLDLVQGRYNRDEAIRLLGLFVDQKIRFLEDSIHQDMLEEDIRHREKRIRELQDEWKELREELQASNDDRLDLHLRASTQPTL